jgi:ubiquinone/menaquinone biosynthesis C-methylase UbiE
MMQTKTNEHFAAEAFTLQSSVFDSVYSSNTIINYKRERVRKHLLKYIKPGDYILELNSGTGEDAIYFAAQGFRVHATDISAGMHAVLKKKVKALKLDDKISFELCSFTDLSSLQNKGPYDFIFSNFAGLNCTGQLDEVLESFNGLLTPGGIVTLVLLPKFCLWEALLLLKGKFRTATRRWFNKDGAKANVEGRSFKCWYYNPSFVIGRLKDKFEHISTEGLCTIVPPSYIEGFAEKYPKTYQFLWSKEEHYKGKWPWKASGDYYIITLQKK